MRPDVRAVLCQCPRYLELANAVQVTDHPIELLEGVLRRLAVAVGLLLLRVVGVLLVTVSFGHRVLPRRLPAAGLRLLRARPRRAGLLRARPSAGATIATGARARPVSGA